MFDFKIRAKTLKKYTVKRQIFQKNAQKNVKKGKGVYIENVTNQRLCKNIKPRQLY